ncbi:retrotransposon protein [Cucumis melo var. makuwa]|uniref:Retrotransposon protein n=1 Tax=Cucumis melo var. makuwa TaxID=1194695 RepID=A0A5D3DHA3_CUCMM|nr:retrotransposon protein [Cucumis melo var. makuwa]TYK22858.1 retrotransposon protein [Cucumis melo var. makuwa]
MMTFKIPGSNVHASTINSRIKLLKRMFHAIAEMRGPTCNGFGWNDEQKCIVVEKEVFDDLVKAFAADVVLDTDFQPMYTQGLNMLPDELMGTRTARVSEGRRKPNTSRGCPTVGGHPLELTLMDRCRLMRILMRNIDDMKAFLDVSDNMKYSYCNIILQEN